VGGSFRYLGGAVGFGFGAVWMTAGLGSAIVCLLFAALGYGAVFVAGRAQAEAHMRRSPNQTLDGFELDHGRDHEKPDDATSPLAAEAEYGWPRSYDAGAEGKPERAHAEVR
jgi:hypothetical protein